MVELIIAFVISINVNAGSIKQHYKMNAYTAEKISEMDAYDLRGGDEAFYRYVTIDNSIKDDIVITDDDNPKQ